MDDIATLRGSSTHETARTQQYSPFLRGVNDRRRLLPGISLVQKRKYHGLPEETPRCQSI